MSPLKRISKKNKGMKIKSQSKIPPTIPIFLLPATCLISSPRFNPSTPLSLSTKLRDSF
jgi:hypothetical protein